MVKKLSLFLLIALLFIFSCAYADMGDEATLGGLDSSGNYRFRVNSSGTLIPAATSGIQAIYEALAASDTLTAAETGKKIIMTAAGTITLPAAAVGLEYTVITGAAVAVSVDTNSVSDTIKYLSLSAGDKLTNGSATGDSVTLVCGRANTWDLVDLNGSWSDGN